MSATRWHLLLAGLSLGCSEANEPIATTTVEARGITWEEFRATATIAPNGKLVVEGDMTFRDEEHLRRFWEEDRAPRSRQELTVATTTVGGVSVDDRRPFPESFDVSYCVGSTFSASQLAALLPALDDATTAWSRVAAVRFRRVAASPCNASTTSVKFDIQLDALGTYFGYAPFPSDPRSLSTMFLTNSTFTTNENGRTLTGILTHELGHTLGFRHEHIWVAPDCTKETPDFDGYGARQLTALDELSVMFYPQCRTPPGGGYQLTHLDHMGSVSLYGLAPALTMSLL